MKGQITKDGVSLRRIGARDVRPGMMIYQIDANTGELIEVGEVTRVATKHPDRLQDGCVVVDVVGDGQCRLGIGKKYWRVDPTPGRIIPAAVRKAAKKLGDDHPAVKEWRHIARWRMVTINNADAKPRKFANPLFLRDKLEAAARRVIEASAELS